MTRGFVQIILAIATDFAMILNFDYLKDSIERFLVK